MKKINWSTKANKRLLYYYRYYCKQSGLTIADGFNSEIENAMNSIAKNPYIASIYDESSALRKYVVRKYPFVIFYKITNNLISSSTTKLLAISL